MGEPLPHLDDVRDLEHYPRDRKPTGLLWPLAFMTAFAIVGWYVASR